AVTEIPVSRRLGKEDRGEDEATSRVDAQVVIDWFLRTTRAQAARRGDGFSVFFVSFSTASTAIPLTYTISPPSQPPKPIASTPTTDRPRGTLLSAGRRSRSQKLIAKITTAPKLTAKWRFAIRLISASSIEK